MVDAGAWGPEVAGGRGRRWPARLLAAVATLVVAAVAAVAAVGALAVRTVADNLEVVALGGLETAEEGRPLHVLVVGSDARDDLTPQEREQLSLGSGFDGQRSDTVILASVSADRTEVSLVSFPRDLVVSDTDGGIAKLTETYGSGREELLRAVREDLGFPVNHYVEVSISGFIRTVEVVGAVRLCLDEPLRDRNSGADLPAGCQELDPEQSLAYVRSRQGALADFERIQRQQVFIRALLSRIVDLRLLLDPGRLVAVAEEVSGNVVTDDQLSIPRMVQLAQDLQGAIDDVEMVTVPGYPQRLQDGGVGKDFVVAYEPGLDALRAAVVDGQEVPTRGTAEQRDEVRVGLWTGGRAGGAVVESTLLYGGFAVQPLGQGQADAGATTSVVAAPGAAEQAGWVAAHLGAPLIELPDGVELPDGYDVLVLVGDDAGSRSEPA